MGNTNKKIITLESNGISVVLKPLNKNTYISTDKFIIKDKIYFKMEYESIKKYLCYRKTYFGRLGYSFTIKNNLEYEEMNGKFYFEKENDEIIFKSYVANV